MAMQIPEEILRLFMRNGDAAIAQTGGTPAMRGQLVPEQALAALQQPQGAVTGQTAPIRPVSAPAPLAPPQAAAPAPMNSFMPSGFSERLASMAPAPVAKPNPDGGGGSGFQNFVSDFQGGGLLGAISGKGNRTRAMAEQMGIPAALADGLSGRELAMLVLQKQKGTAPDYQLAQGADGTFVRFDKNKGEMTALPGNYAKPDSTKWQKLNDTTLYDASTGATKPLEGTDPSKVLPKDQREASNELRDEFNGTVLKPYVAAREGYQKVLAGAKGDSAADDIALIFGYMKTLDPTSTVREGEFATASQAGGVGEQVLNLYNRAISGERLQPGQRTMFASSARKQFEVAEHNFNGEKNRYTSLAGQYGVNPALVIRDFEQVEEPSAAKPVAAPSAPVDYKDFFR
jgi:hypothetical protein